MEKELDRIEKEVAEIEAQAETKSEELKAEIDDLYDQRDACNNDLAEATEAGDQKGYEKSFARIRYLEDRIGYLEKQRELLEEGALISSEQWKKFSGDIHKEWRTDVQEHRKIMLEAWDTFWKHARQLQIEANIANYQLDRIHDDVLRTDFDGWRNTVPEKMKNQNRNYKRASSYNWDIAKTRVDDVMRNTGCADFFRR